MERKSVTTDFAWWRLRASVPFPLIGLIVGLPPQLQWDWSQL